MQIVNIDYINDRELIVLGLVKGSTLHLNPSQGVSHGLNSIETEELTNYQQTIENARNDATNKMIADAERLDADAIVNVCFTTSPPLSGTSEILACGTAVKFKHPDTLQQF